MIYQHKGHCTQFVQRRTYSQHIMAIITEINPFCTILSLSASYSAAHQRQKIHLRCTKFGAKLHYF